MGWVVPEGKMAEETFSAALKEAKERGIDLDARCRVGHVLAASHHDELADLER